MRMKTDSPAQRAWVSVLGMSLGCRGKEVYCITNAD